MTGGIPSDPGPSKVAALFAGGRSGTFSLLLTGVVSEI
jgi:hypothetical protein